MGCVHVFMTPYPGTGDVPPWWSAGLAPLDLIPNTIQTECGVNICNPSTMVVETRRSYVQSHLELHGEF